MELKLYYAILRRWLWLILLCTLLAAAGAYFFSSQQTRVYQARSTVLLDNSKAASDGQAYSDILAGERLARTYAEMFNGRQSLDVSLEKLGYQPDILNISVSPQRDTTLLSVIVESSDPEAAAFLANTLPDVVAEQQRTRQAARYATTKASLTEELNSLASDIAAEREAVARLSATAGEDDAEVSSRNATLGLQQTTYETLLQNLAAIRLAEAQELDVLSLVEPAVVPTVPIRPRVPLNTLLAAIVGTIIGLGTGFLIEYLDDSVKASSDFARLFGMGPLAFIGRIEEQGERVLVSALDNRAPIAEAYRMLRTNIRFAAVDGPLKTVLVTSPSPGEGKSTTSANLAVVLAQAGHHTILVDADLRRPTQHRVFKVSNQRGLTTALVERSTTVREFLQASEIEGLSILPTGPLPPNPSELLGSQRMRDLLVELESEADYVVLDSPPILAVSDSSLLASSASGVLLVMRANSTSVEAAKRALEQLEGAQANILGTVLNDVQSGREGYYYYYYYHQYYTSSEEPQDPSGSGGASGPSSTSRQRKNAKSASLASKIQLLLLNVIPRRG